MNLSGRMVFRTPRRPTNVLELRSPKGMGFFWGFPKFSLQLFFRNANGWVLQELKQPFFYKTNGCLWMDEKKIIDKWVIIAKWYWCQINEHKSCIGHVLFFKKIFKGKLKFCSVNADTKTSMSRFPNSL